MCKLKESIFCTICGSKCVTNDGKNCSSIKLTGKRCGGKVYKNKCLIIKSHNQPPETHGGLINAVLVGCWRVKL